MSTIHETLQALAYPGRMVLVGQLNERVFAAYVVTARNPINKARRYVLKAEQALIDTVTTDAELMAQGDLEILQYSCAHLFSNGFVIANGRHGASVRIEMDEGEAQEVLKRSIENWTYEPDKYCTPRIAGCVVNHNGHYTVALSRVRADQAGESIRDVYSVPLIVNTVHLMRTYRGDDVRPTPSFEEAPVVFSLNEQTPKEFARAIYNALAPKAGADDFRVSVVTIFEHVETQERSIEIINAVDETS